MRLNELIQAPYKVLGLVISITLLGCSTAPDETQQPGSETNASQAQSGPNNVYDPLESINRVMWDFNYDYLDPYLVRPVSLTYVNYTPVPVRSGVRNFLANLDEPFSMVNNAVMGNGSKAVDHFNRFWINSTFGLLGLIDIASAAGIEKRDKKEFSDAIGHYGVGNGPYFMVPGYGPITLREGADVVDGLYLPLSLLSFWGSVGKWAFEGMETRAQLVSQEATLENSPDSYSLMRDVYIQRQNFNAEIEVEFSQDSEEEALIDSYLEEDYFNE